MNRKLALILVSLSFILSPIYIYSSIIYTQENVNSFNPDIAVVLGSGTAGISEIGVNGTSAMVNVSRNWWNLDYDYRRRISIVNSVASTLGSGYSVCLTVNTTSLVSDGKMLPSGDDLRIVYGNRASWIEIDRDVMEMNTSSTQVWFKTKGDVSANGSDNNYYMYYGNSSAMNPPANKSNVYDFWDDFDDTSLDPAWTFSSIGGAAGSYSESGTVVILNATTSGDLWSTSDDFLFLSITRNYNILVESYTSSWAGSHQTWSKMGGVQLRQSLDANSQNRIMSPVYSAVGATNSHRLSTGGSTSEQTTATQSKYNRLSRIGGTSRAWYSTDGISWTELGSQISFSGGLSDSVRVGIHLAGLSSSSHWVEVDWFKARKYVDPEPSTSLGSEERNIVDYVDNNSSNVDYSADKGTHGNFSAQQYGPDSIFDALAEGNTGSIEGGYKTQQGVTVLTSTNQTQTITAVNSMNRAFVILSHFYAQPNRPASDNNYDPYGNPDRMAVSAYLENTTTIRFERGSSATDAVVSYTVVECFNEEFLVYRGASFFSGTTTTYNPSIGGTVNGTNCFAWINGAWTDTTSDIGHVRYLFFTANVSDGTQTTLNIRRGLGYNGVNGTLRWIVVEFDVGGNFGGAIDKGEINLSNQYDGNPATATVIGCNKSRSVLMAQIRTTGDDGLNTHAFSAYLEGSTTAKFYVYDNNYARTVQWYVIDFGSGVVSNQGSRYGAVKINFKIYMDLLGTGETSPSLAETIGYVAVNIGGSKVHGTHGGVAFETGLVGSLVVNGHDDATETWSYTSSFTTKPAVAIVSSDTNGGSDGRIMVYDWTDSSNTAISIHVDEDEIGDTEQSHGSSEDGFYLVFETAGNHSGGSGKLKCEWGTVNITDSWTTVNLVNTYSNPVVVATYKEGVQTYFRPQIARIQNVTSSSFEIHVVVDNKTTGISQHEYSYFVAEEGEYEFDDGTNVKVGSSTTTQIHREGTSGTGFGTQLNLDVSLSGWTNEPAMFCFVQSIVNGNNTFYYGAPLEGSISGGSKVDFASGDAIMDRSLETTVQQNRSWSMVYGTCDGDGTAFPRPFQWHYVNSTGGTLVIRRTCTGQPRELEWQVLELPAPNYELDLEVQFTDVNYTQMNEELCIYTGTMSTEELRVEVWNGSAWQIVFTNLTSGWNNVSVSSYLTSPTFTIRFKGDTETDDVTQDNWNIDTTLLHAWTEGYTCDYILSVTSQKTYDQNITLNLYNYSNIDRLSNCTIWFRDGTTSVQINITNGIVIQDVGSWYILPASETRYIVVYVEEFGSGTSGLFIRLEAVKASSIVYTCLIKLTVK